jgi:hypothetical protein
VLLLALYCRRVAGMVLKESRLEACWHRIAGMGLSSCRLALQPFESMVCIAQCSYFRNYLLSSARGQRDSKAHWES